MSKKKSLLAQRIKGIIKREFYEGIRDQDGWEVLGLTVRAKYPSWAEEILAKLRSELNG